MYLDNERRPTLTPQLAWRVAILGGIALVAFAVIFFRLWYLQVLSGDKYEATAKTNQLRKIKVQAPRGEIVDREGRVLVRNRVGLAVTITPDTLPDERAGARGDLPAPGQAARHARGTDRAARGRAVRGAALLQGHGQAGREPRQRDVHRGAPRGLPRRGHRAGLPARIPARRDRRPPVRLRRRGDPGAARRSALRRRDAGRPRGQGRHRGRVRPLPARAQRRHPGARGRLRQPGQEPRRRPIQEGQAAAPLARPRRAADRPAGARRRHGQGRLRGDGRAKRRGAGARLASLVRPQPVRQGGARVRLQAPDLRRDRRAAHQPRGVGRLPDRLDLQADHRHGRARGGLHHAGHGPDRRRARSPSGPRSSRTPATSCTARSRCARR